MSQRTGSIWYSATASNQFDEAKKVMADARTETAAGGGCRHARRVPGNREKVRRIGGRIRRRTQAETDDPQLLRRYVRLLLNIGKNHDAAAFCKPCWPSRAT